jgi:hypothetical protein
VAGTEWKTPRHFKWQISNGKLKGRERIKQQGKAKGEVEEYRTQPRTTHYELRTPDNRQLTTDD